MNEKLSFRPLTHNDLPVDLLPVAKEICGEQFEVAPLSGLSGNPVFRINGLKGAIIAKGHVSRREMCFYKEGAQTLGLGRHTPELLYSYKLKNSTWILIENIPIPSNRDDLLNHPDFFRILGTLHSRDCNIIDIPDPFLPIWTHDMNRRAIAELNFEVAREIKDQLDDLASDNKSLFEPRCVISGDPNPTNWGLRQDGSLSLFDWGRFGYGTPALDLGIAIQTFDTSDIYCKTAENYLRAQHSQQVSIESIAKLERQIKVARIWILIDFLCMVADGAAKIDKDRWPSYEKTITEIRNRLPAFLNSLV